MENTMEDLLEGRRMLVSAVMKAEAKSVAEKVPDQGMFCPVSWAMSYYGTDHEGRLYTQYSAECGCAIRASMLIQKSGAEVSNYVFFGSKQECLDWLGDSAHVDELIEVYHRLAERADAREV